MNAVEKKKERVKKRKERLGAREVHSQLVPVTQTMPLYCENIDCNSPTMETMPVTPLSWRYSKKRAARVSSSPP